LLWSGEDRKRYNSEQMSEQANTAESTKEILLRLARVFGCAILGLVLRSYDQICAEQGHGEIVILIKNGKAVGVNYTPKLRPE
jgi:hypothetical protein